MFCHKITFLGISACGFWLHFFQSPNQMYPGKDRQIQAKEGLKETKISHFLAELGKKKKNLSK